MAIREVAMLALLGGGLGVLLAAAIVPGMQRYLPPALDFRGPLHLDWIGVICALLLVVLATLAAGVASQRESPARGGPPPCSHGKP
jgi:ABC-type antimicrobial peptide transport system permease subunit